MQKPGFHAIASAALACALYALPAAADSQVRIVRLSDVQGTVQINKNSGLGFERAFDNLPITQQTQLRTLENGRAEIEFEDGSTLRITPNTTIAFSTLSLNDAGKRLSTVYLVEGKAYVNWLGKNSDELTLNFSSDKVELKQPAHFRVEISSGVGQLASFKNTVEVVAPSGTVKVDKNRTVTFDEAANKPIEAKSKKDPYDQWDEQSVDYHDQYSKNNSAPYGYGVSDLSYYGGYTNVPGYGVLWQPYFTGGGWNPFMDGAWAWYPGMGFMWASAYPWGWMPYYYGNWMYAPGYGWGWQPGTWNTWRGGLHFVGATALNFHAPVAPAGTVNTVAVGRGGPASTSVAGSRMLVSVGSAGLGIPRGSFANLHQLNKEVAKAGSVDLRVAPQFAATSHPAMSGFGFGEGRSPGMGEPGRMGSAPAGQASAGVGGHVSH
jgi:FecR protein